MIDAPNPTTITNADGTTTTFDKLWVTYVGGIFGDPNATKATGRLIIKKVAIGKNGDKYISPHPEDSFDIKIDNVWGEAAADPSGLGQALASFADAIITWSVSKGHVS